MNTYPITFTPEQLDTIAQALNEMPYRVAAPILETIQVQFNQLIQSRTTNTEDVPVNTYE